MNCPECGAEMDHHYACGTDRLGREQEVSSDVCPECETIVDDFGNVMTLEDQKEAMEEARWYE